MSYLSDTLLTENRSLDDVPHSPKRNEPIGFLLRLAKALHTYGLPAYELEHTLNACAKALNHGIQCVSSPTSISMTLLPPDDLSQTYIIRVSPGSIDLDKLHQVSQVAQEVISGNLSSDSGAAKLKAIALSDSKYPVWLSLIAFALVSACVARIFSGGLMEMLSAGTIGMLVGGLALASRTRPFLDHLLPSISAFLATVLAFILNHFFAQNIVISVAIISGLIILLPGLSLTIAMAELATQNMVSGTARLMGAMTVFIQLTFGSAIGVEVSQHLGLNSPDSVVIMAVPLWSVLIAVCFAAVALVPLFEARKKDIGWVLLASLTAFISVFLASKLFGASLGAFCGAICVGLLAKLVTHLKGIPGAVIMMPGFIILVPGTIGYKSILALLDKDILTGLQTAFEVSLIGISLVAGFLISSMLPLPKDNVKDDY